MPDDARKKKLVWVSACIAGGAKEFLAEEGLGDYGIFLMLAPLNGEGFVQSASNIDKARLVKLIADQVETITGISGETGAGETKH